MATTTQIRSWWSPPCVGPYAKVALYGKGVVAVRPDVVDAVHALSSCLEHFKYPTRARDTGAYNCRKITGGSGFSLHAYGVAIDINWSTNPYGRTLQTDMPPAMVKAIKAIRTRNGKQVWRWGGDYVGNKDAMHFEVVCHPVDLATGIDPKSLPKPAPPVTPPKEFEDMAAPTRIIQGVGNNSIYISNGIHKRLLSDTGTETIEEQIAQLKLAGLTEENGSNPFMMDNDTVSQIRTV